MSYEIRTEDGQTIGSAIGGDPQVVAEQLATTFGAEAIGPYELYREGLRVAGFQRDLGRMGHGPVPVEGDGRAPLLSGPFWRSDEIRDRKSGMRLPFWTPREVILVLRCGPSGSI